MKNDFYKRLARAETMACASKAELMETLRTAYQNACKEQDEEQAARLARKIRNKLLDSSDKEMSLDRLGLDTSSMTKFISSFAKIITGSWAVYRQALRDIPEQNGFPFDIEFPVSPNDKNNTI